jgi:RimJ/RimL family protein N-acetyltransferase
MGEHLNNLGQPIGFPIERRHERPRPPRSAMTGNYCKVEPLNPDVHATDLYQAYAKDKDHRNWTYLPYGPFSSFQDYQTWLKIECLSDDPLFHAIIDIETAKAVGVASYLRIEPSVGVIEVGHIHYSPQLQKTAAATEAMYLMMRRVFDELGYRRYEWKCDALNAGSRKAAVRLGFLFEGVFRQATIYKGRNRDTAWYSIIDREWPMLKKAFEKWLNPANFDTEGQQRESLSKLVSQARNEAYQRSGSM